MKKNKGKFLFFSLLFLLGVIYLILPSPEYPDLRDSARSDEPGDTWQHPDQKGYYSDLTRQEVLSDIQSQFTIKLFGITVPNFRLNYRVEDAGTLVRDQLKSNYLEEIVYPLREAIFVNGWEPKKSPENAHLSPRQISDLSIHGVIYEAKVTLRPVYSPVWARLLVWTLIFPATYLVYLSLKKSMSSLA